MTHGQGNALTDPDSPALRVLVVEDEMDIGRLVQTTLEREGYAVEIATRGSEALQRIESAPPDLIVLDLKLPDLDGLEICQWVRNRADYIPIVVLTAKQRHLDKVIGLELGADDYVSKPFNPRELAARVRAVFRLAGKRPHMRQPADRLVIDERFEIDLARKSAIVEGRTVNVNPKEFQLLTLLATNRGKTFDRNTLLERVFGSEGGVGSRTVDAFVQRLRIKLEPDLQNPRYILTVPEVGFKFAEEPEA